MQEHERQVVIIKKVFLTGTFTGIYTFRYRYIHHHHHHQVILVLSCSWTRTPTLAHERPHTQFRSRRARSLFAHHPLHFFDIRGATFVHHDVLFATLTMQISRRAEKKSQGAKWKQKLERSGSSLDASLGDPRCRSHLYYYPYYHHRNHCFYN